MLCQAGVVDCRELRLGVATAPVGCLRSFLCCTVLYCCTCTCAVLPYRHWSRQSRVAAQGPSGCVCVYTCVWVAGGAGEGQDTPHRQEQAQAEVHRSHTRQPGCPAVHVCGCVWVCRCVTVYVCLAPQQRLCAITSRGDTCWTCSGWRLRLEPDRASLQESRVLLRLAAKP